MPKPSLVALDAAPMTAARPGQSPPPGEPTWDALRDHADVTVHPRTAPTELLDRLANAQLALTNKVVFDAPTLADLPDLRYVGVTATGTNIIDLDAARDQGVTVTNVPGYSTASVAQHAIALLLELTNRVQHHADAVNHGDWAASPDFAFTVAPITELADRALLIVGMGTIGRATATIAHALGMRILASNQRSRDAVNAMPDVARLNVTWGELDELLPQADAVSLHCPLTNATHHLINAARLNAMKPSAVVLNTGRGPLIDEPALAAALQARTIAGAGLDVLSAEPPPADHPLVGLPNCVVTPHAAWASQAARQRLMHTTSNNVAAFLAGQPTNVVS